MNKVKLGEVVDIISGFAFDSKMFNDYKGTPLIRIRDIKRGYTETYTSQEYDKKYIIKKGDILIGMDGEFNIGKWKAKDALLNQRVCKIIPKKIDEDYMFFLLPKKLKEIENKTAFVTVKHLSVKQIENIEINLIEIEQQKEIAKRLRIISRIIEIKQIQKEQLDELIKSQFVEMFERGQYPKDEFINIAKEIYAGGDKPKDISKVQDDEYLYPVFANGYENEGLQGYSKSYRTGDNAVTISARGTIGYSFIRNEKFTPIVRLITIIPNEKANVVYLKYAIDNLNIAGSGTSQAQLTVPDIKKKKITIPPIELQNQFADIVKQIDKQKFEIQKSLDEMQNLYESLMNEYFG